MKYDLSMDAWKAPKIDGWRYKKIKSFRSQRRAEEYAETLKNDNGSLRSRRLLPIVQQVRIGLGFGYLYRVCIPDRKE